MGRWKWVTRSIVLSKIWGRDWFWRACSFIITLSTCASNCHTPSQLAPPYQIMKWQTFLWRSNVFCFKHTCYCSSCNIMTFIAKEWNSFHLTRMNLDSLHFNDFFNENVNPTWRNHCHYPNAKLLLLVASQIICLPIQSNPIKSLKLVGGWLSQSLGINTLPIICV